MLYIQSAPQILISTTFLVKVESAEISPVVILSVLVSFWTLAARVSSDDAIMMKDNWKNINVALCPYPYINPRWILRVFVWRFLEISSRIISSGDPSMSSLRQ